MKRLIPITLVFILIVASCTSNKNIGLDTKPLLIIENPYWQKIFPGQEDGDKQMVLILPYDMALENYKVDSVYFKGYHERLKESTMSGKTVYRARITLQDNLNLITPPYTIEENEALVSYEDKNGTKRHFRVKNILRKEPIYMP